MSDQTSSPTQITPKSSDIELAQAAESEAASASTSSKKVTKKRKATAPRKKTITSAEHAPASKSVPKKGNHATHADLYARMPKNPYEHEGSAHIVNWVYKLTATSGGTFDEQAVESLINTDLKFPGPFEHEGKGRKLPNDELKGIYKQHFQPLDTVMSAVFTAVCGVVGFDWWEAWYALRNNTDYRPDMSPSWNLSDSGEGGIHGVDRIDAPEDVKFLSTLVWFGRECLINPGGSTPILELIPDLYSHHLPLSLLLPKYRTHLSPWFTIQRGRFVAQAKRALADTSVTKGAELAKMSKVLRVWSQKPNGRYDVMFNRRDALVRRMIHGKASLMCLHEDTDPEFANHLKEGVSAIEEMMEAAASALTLTVQAGASTLAWSIPQQAKEVTDKLESILTLASGALNDVGSDAEQRLSLAHRYFEDLGVSRVIERIICQPGKKSNLYFTAATLSTDMPMSQSQDEMAQSGLKRRRKSLSPDSDDDDLQ